jgi:hypothetical protein
VHFLLGLVAGLLGVVLEVRAGFLGLVAGLFAEFLGLVGGVAGGVLQFAAVSLVLSLIAVPASLTSGSLAML